MCPAGPGAQSGPPFQGPREPAQAPAAPPGRSAERRLSGCARPGPSGKRPGPGSVGSARRKRFPGPSFGRKPAVKIALSGPFGGSNTGATPPPPTSPQKMGVGAACVWPGFGESAPEGAQLPRPESLLASESWKERAAPRAPVCSPKAGPLETPWPPTAKRERGQNRPGPSCPANAGSARPRGRLQGVLGGVFQGFSPIN